MSKWRYKVHPAADVFPIMSDEELDTLGKDIEENGLREPIAIMHVGPEENRRERVLSADTHSRWPQPACGDGTCGLRPR